MAIKSAPDTKEMRAVAALLASMHDMRLDGAKVREAMEWSLGFGKEIAAPADQPAAAAPMNEESARASFEQWHVQRQRGRGFGTMLTDAEFLARDEDSGRYRTIVGLDDAFEAWKAGVAFAAPPVGQQAAQPAIDACMAVRAEVAKSISSKSAYGLSVVDACIRLIRARATNAAMVAAASTGATHGKA